jgi:hypothetical protein
MNSPDVLSGIEAIAVKETTIASARPADRNTSTTASVPNISAKFSQVHKRTEAETTANERAHVSDLRPSESNMQVIASEEERDMGSGKLNRANGPGEPSESGRKRKSPRLANKTMSGGGTRATNSAA